jgi:hypothetical protein
MMGEPIEDLVLRVEKLEQRLATWRRWAVGLGALTLAGLALGARPDEPKDPAEGVFQGRKVILRDERGEVRAILSAGSEDGGTLILRGKEGRGGATLSVMADGSVALTLKGPGGHKALFGVDPEDGPVLDLGDDREPRGGRPAEPKPGAE